VWKIAKVRLLLKFYNLKNFILLHKPSGTSAYPMLAYQSTQDSVNPLCYCIPVSYELWLNKWNVITRNDSLTRTMSIFVSTTSLNPGVSHHSAQKDKITSFIYCIQQVMAPEWSSSWKTVHLNNALYKKTPTKCTILQYVIFTNYILYCAFCWHCFVIIN
jgi:hypothetical protein